MGKVVQCYRKKWVIHIERITREKASGATARTRSPRMARPRASSRRRTSRWPTSIDCHDGVDTRSLRVIPVRTASHGGGRASNRAAQPGRDIEHDKLSAVRGGVTSVRSSCRHYKL